MPLFGWGCARDGAGVGWRAIKMVCCMTCKKRSSLMAAFLAASFSISIFFFSNSINSLLPFSSEARKLSIIFCIDFSTLSSLLSFLFFFFRGSPSSGLGCSEEPGADIPDGPGPSADWSCSTACSDIATGPTDSAPSGLSAATVTPPARQVFQCASRSARPLLMESENCR